MAQESKSRSSSPTGSPTRKPSTPSTPQLQILAQSPQAPPPAPRLAEAVLATYHPVDTAQCTSTPIASVDLALATPRAASPLTLAKHVARQFFSRQLQKSSTSGKARQKLAQLLDLVDGPKPVAVASPLMEEQPLHVPRVRKRQRECDEEPKILPRKRQRLQSPPRTIDQSIVPKAHRDLPASMTRLPLSPVLSPTASPLLPQDNLFGTDSYTFCAAQENKYTWSESAADVPRGGLGFEPDFGSRLAQYFTALPPTPPHTSQARATEADDQQSAMSMSDLTMLWNSDSAAAAAAVSNRANLHRQRQRQHQRRGYPRSRQTSRPTSGLLQSPFQLASGGSASGSGKGGRTFSGRSVSTASNGASNGGWDERDDEPPGV